ncbi:sulfatase family protein [Flexithrix dorotheae]|uniref:sulfatase family protein n=1 Tax=Flexithrix dorotheae TaxID=70993 RepID=UPI000362C923|nr:sulfatase [Flexithrix dorotheae]
MKTPLLVLTFLYAFAAFGQDQKLPHIIIYLADDLGVKDAGIYGAAVVRTPNIDALGKEGMVFENAFVASPSCAPSRAALLTGLMPAKNGAENNHTYPKSDVDILTRNLQQKGYKIFAFGKVAHGKMNNACGFNYYNKSQVNLANNVKEFLNQQEIDGPVCLMIGDRRPHVLWTEKYSYDPKEVDLPPNFIETEETRNHRARYYSDVTGFDSTMGEIMKFTADLLGSNTLFLFSSDHGAQWPFGKWNLYDAGIRTPLIVKWKDKIKAGFRTSAMVSWVDILPTILDITKSKIPDHIDGKSFANVLLNNKPDFREVIYTTHSGDGIFNVYPIRSIRTKRYKYIRNLYPENYHTNHSDLLRKNGAGAYWNSWDQQAKTNSTAASIIRKYYQRPPEEFFDLENDPDERANLISNPAYQKDIEWMKNALMEWMKKQGDSQTLFHSPYLLSKPKPNKHTIDSLKNLKQSN